MLTPFLKYVSEGKVIRRHSDLQRFSFPEVTERIYLSFLALALMSQLKDSKQFTKMYTDQTMAKGTFDQVRMVNNDLANMLAIVSGDPEITKKLKNKNEAQAMRQRQPVPVMALRRYMRTWEDHYKNLTQLERALNINDGNYRNVRRAVANYRNLNSRQRTNTIKTLNRMLNAKLPSTDLQRRFKQLTPSDE
tara:strand:+ start:5435 stop:6010 length:576 start_codon:yes stop_codon:yes gene_type:complete